MSGRRKEGLMPSVDPTELGPAAQQPEAPTPPTSQTPASGIDPQRGAVSSPPQADKLAGGNWGKKPSLGW